MNGADEFDHQRRPVNPMGERKPAQGPSACEGLPCQHNCRTGSSLRAETERGQGISFWTDATAIMVNGNKTANKGIITFVGDRW